MSNELVRIDEAALPGVRIRAQWAANLNDQRLVSEPADVSTWKARLLRELKVMLLFNSETMLVADTELLNNPAFQSAFLNNDHELQEAFSSGRVKVALRGTADNLSHCNQLQGLRRAEPNMLERAKPFAEKFDLFASEARLPTYPWSLDGLANSFRAMCASLTTSESPLSPGDRILISEAVNHATQGDERKPLLFGDIYGYLVREKQYHDIGVAIQAIRSAYLLNPPMHLGLVPSLPVDDFDLEIALFFLRRSQPGMDAPTLGDEQWEPLLPTKILTERGLDSVSFCDIAALQRHGHDVGYFDALAKVRNAQDLSEQRERRAALLMALHAYLEAMGRERNVQLTEYQKGIARQGLEVIDKKSEARRRWSWFVPVVVYVSLSFLGISIGIVIGSALGAAGLTQRGVDLLNESATKREQLAMKSLLSGNLVLSTPNK